jgi:hypothetical protein
MSIVKCFEVQQALPRSAIFTEIDERLLEIGCGDDSLTALVIFSKSLN